MITEAEKVANISKDKRTSSKRSFGNPQILQHEEVPEEKYDTEITETKVPKVTEEVAEVKKVLEEAINSIIERGEKLDELNIRTETLAVRSREFNSNTKQVRRKTWWENQKMRIIIGVIVFVIMAIIIGVIVGVVLIHK